MNISENILKLNLENVLFLVGSACGGKTTMAREIAKKHNMLYFDEYWQMDKWNGEIVDPLYQPNSANRKTTDWEAYFSRSVEEFLADKTMENTNDEYLEFLLVELIKASQSTKVITDIWIKDYDFLLKISDHSHIACLLAPGELIIQDYYNRKEHLNFTNCIKSLKEPNKKFATQNELFEIGAIKEAEKAKKYKLFSIMRSKTSTIDGTLKLLEGHFGL